MQSTAAEADEALRRAAEDLADILMCARRRVVFAESCTAGMIAASLARIPGIGEWLCGSAVVYRNETKTAWLGIMEEQLNDAQIGPVSAPTARGMVSGILRATPQAEFAAAVTGHLGPNAPPDLDGVVFIACAGRDPLLPSQLITVRKFIFQPPEGVEQGVELRQWRQLRAAGETLLMLSERIRQPAGC